MLNHAQKLLNGIKCTSKALYSFAKTIELVDRKTVELAIDLGNHQRSVSLNKCPLLTGKPLPTWRFERRTARWTTWKLNRFSCRVYHTWYFCRQKWCLRQASGELWPWMRGIESRVYGVGVLRGIWQVATTLWLGSFACMSKSVYASPYLCVPTAKYRPVKFFVDNELITSM